MSSSPLDSLSDAELYVALRQGNTQALGVLYDRHARLVYGISYKLLGNSQAAEDLTQDVFVTLACTDSYDPKRGALRTYLSILTRSRALDRLRSRGAATRKIDRLIAFHRLNPSINPPVDRATQNEQGQMLGSALSQLSAQERQVLYLMYFEGLSQTAVAAHLEIPLGTVKTRSRRGLNKLRQILTEPIGEATEQ